MFVGQERFSHNTIIPAPPSPVGKIHRHVLSDASQTTVFGLFIS
jgi:hypothetical protein